MFSVRTMLLGLSFSATALLAGLAANAAPSTQPLVCDGCKITVVKVADSNKGQFHTYHNVAKMTCPACKDAVTNFITTGKFEHSCSACGPSTPACDAHGN